MIPVIELLIDEEQDKIGVFAISMVAAPAIESNFVALSKQDVQLKVMDNEKRLVLGLALIPDKEIYRNNGNQEYNIKFSKDTVRKASQIYMRELFGHNTTLEHQAPVEGAYVVESWIVEDPDRDKTALYNIEAPEGSWAIAMRVENDEVWEQVKNGEVMGFSIEGLFDEKKVDTFREKWEKIKAIINDDRMNNG